jgi:hypothetical protein
MPRDQEPFSMKWLAFALSLGLVVMASAARAQDPEDPAPLPAPLPASPERATPMPQKSDLTPEMQRYLVEVQRYGALQDLPRQRAQLKAQQRMERMAALKWYGLSNARPTAMVTPFMGAPYAPHWTGNAANGNWSDRGYYRAYTSAVLHGDTTQR